MKKQNKNNNWDWYDEWKEALGRMGITIMINVYINTLGHLPRGYDILLVFASVLWIMAVIPINRKEKEVTNDI